VEETSKTPKEQRVAALNMKSAEKWRGWIEGRIRDDVLRLHQQRVVWDGMQQVIHANPDLPRSSVLWEYLFDTYTAAQAAAVRRLAETEDQVGSLGQLLHQIGTGNEGAVTREWWMSGWPTRWNRKGEGNQIFDGLAGVGVGAFPEQTALRDLGRLRATAANVKLWVDRYVAHMDKRGLDLEQAPSVRELHDAIDVIRSLYVRYSLLLTRTSDARAELALDVSNWRDPLKRPWITAPRTPADAAGPPCPR